MEIIFGSNKVNEEQSKRIDELRKNFHSLAATINDNLYDSREKSLAITKLEEACMWAVKGISIEKEREQKYGF